jgi:hypothetical protein
LSFLHHHSFLLCSFDGSILLGILGLLYSLITTHEILLIDNISEIFLYPLFINVLIPNDLFVDILLYFFNILTKYLDLLHILLSSIPSLISSTTFFRHLLLYKVTLLCRLIIFFPWLESFTSLAIRIVLTLLNCQHGFVKIIFISFTFSLQNFHLVNQLSFVVLFLLSQNFNNCIFSFFNYKICWIQIICVG